MIVLGVLTDGRSDLLAQTLASVRENLHGDFDHMFIVDDSYRRKGMAGAVQTLWAHALGVGADYLFHLEDDWRFNSPVEVADLIGVLERHHELAQIVLQRQALTGSEVAAGGVAAHPNWVERSDSKASWVEQNDIFSLNPCVIPRRVLEVGWPSGNEAGMTDLLRGKYRFAFWGEKESAPHIHHLGSYRASGWTL